MSDAKRSGTCAAGRRGFTLVELLISIGIIAVLIGILLPALRGVRSQARQSVCLANNRQIALAWILHTNEHLYFPHGKIVDFNGDGVIDHAENSNAIMMFDWGGVDWYTGDSDLENAWFSDERPVNLYLGEEYQHVTHRAEIFRCPSDTGMVYANGAYWSNDEWEEMSASDEAKDTVFGIRGTSYRANEWIWCRIGQRGGFHGQELWQNVTTRNRSFDVAQPSEFVLVGDGGAMYAGRWARESRGSARNEYDQYGPPRGWWHGHERCNFAFYDGSARHVKMEPGTAVTDDYSFYFDRRRHLPWSFVVAWNGAGTPVPSQDASGGGP